ncbi:hypothetical protein [Chryseobacterium gossypii]|uniref:hypothetical protein n=1 Tax=Chryseobacterium gossypii TaxID=3231602 RepID=UPI0035261C79
MKKVLAIAFIGSLLVVNCTKKPDHSLQDSNTMLEEPEAPTVVDSANKKTEKPEADVNAAVSVPSEASKTDSISKK